MVLLRYWSRLARCWRLVLLLALSPPEQNDAHITLTSMKTQNTTTKCTLCGKSTTSKTYYIAETKEGLITYTKCLSPDLKLIEKCGWSESEAKQKAEGLIALRREMAVYLANPLSTINSIFDQALADLQD